MAFRPLDDARIDEQATMLKNRVRNTFRRLHPKFERRALGAFRLYDWDIPEIRAVVDWYEGHLVIAEYEREQTQRANDWIGRMAEAVSGELSVPQDRVHIKRRRTRPKDGERYERLERKNARFKVREGELQFWVNLDDFVDTGLFSDHRLTRARFGQEAAGKRVLNLFCYTASFTCYAARGGAKETVSVDASKMYLRWAEANLALNGCNGELVASDVREFLARERRKFDLCICDPPSFSAGRERAPWDVSIDHPALIQSVLSVMAPGGRLYFSTNHQRFEPRLQAFAGAKEITGETIPEDYRNQRVHRCWLIET